MRYLILPLALTLIAWLLASQVFVHPQQKILKTAAQIAGTIFFAIFCTIVLIGLVNAN